MIKKQYANTRFGQLHLRTLERETKDPQTEADSRPLVLLHPMPYSGLYFTTIMPYLENRHTIAPDYPGCGQSDALASMPTIEDYASAVLDALDNLGVQGKYDFLGFHTGCLVASEIAVSAPERVSSLILIDIPYFDDQQRRQHLASLSSHRAISEDLGCLQQHWDSDITSRIGLVTIERAFELFTDHINAQGDGADGFRAAFNYRTAERLAAINKPTLVVATQSSLYDATLDAAQLIANMSLQELPEVKRACFERDACSIARVVNHWRG